jgi:hypothetical protein
LRGDYIAAAFTVAELGEMLKAEMYKSWYGGGGWTCSYFIPPKTATESDREIYEHGTTEACARAKMLIYLIENKLVSL